MAVKLFAAIVIGSVETELKIFELSPRKGIRELDCIRTRINLGMDAYNSGTLDVAKVKELCAVLKEFKTIMEGYKVDGLRVCATSAMREIRSSQITKDYIEKQTGLKIEILSNSEQRFLDFKSIASESDSFERIIQNGTAIVDIGGSSIQISVFDKGRLITTQNIRMGKVSTRQKFYPMAKNNEHYVKLVMELLEHELNGFGRLYQKDRQINNLIVLDNDLLKLLTDDQNADKPVPSVQKNRFHAVYDDIVFLNSDSIREKYNMLADSAAFVVNSAIICKALLEKFGAEVLWLPSMGLATGMCYDFAVDQKLIRPEHVFDEDIIASARSIAKRYKSNQSHIKYMEELTLQIFDKLKKVHGMGQKERLLLQLSVILHNCGKYISLSNVADCAYNIIMASEIIGLSNTEREIVANVVKFNTAEFAYFDQLSMESSVNTDEYLVIAKLTAILRIANALDRGHRQKCKDATVTLKDHDLTIVVYSNEDMTLEKGTLTEKADFFEEVFSVRPVLHQKKLV